MKVYINELSFEGNAATEDAAFQALEETVRIAASLKAQANNSFINRHRDLKSRTILPNMTLGEFLQTLISSKEPKKQSFAKIFLEIFVKGPYFTKQHGEAESITLADKQNVSETCFDAASAACCGAAMASFPLSANYTNTNITINSSIFGIKKIANYQNASHAEQSRWIFDSNQKHERKKDGYINGELHSSMPLAENEAQQALTNGMLAGRSVFSLFNGKWYKFHRHTNSKFHGFPIDEKTTNTAEFQLAKRYHEKHGENSSGQIHENYCCTSSHCTINQKKPTL